MEDFVAYDFDDFRKNYLAEKSLDQLPSIKLGELSKSITKASSDVAKTLNKWASEIVTKANRYIKKLNKRDGFQANVRYVPVGDGYSGEAAIIVIELSNGTLEAAIFDNNRITIKMSDRVAKVLNKGRKRKFLSNKDRLDDYIIGALEKLNGI